MESCQGLEVGGMQAHRVEAVLAEDGTLTLSGLPFQAGAVVEVIILSHDVPVIATVDRYPLRGTPVRYDAPTEPVGEGDWEALR